MKFSHTCLMYFVIVMGTVTSLVVPYKANAGSNDGPKDFTFNQYVGDTWISKVTAQYSTIQKNVCVGWDLGSCTRSEKRSVQALFLKTVANAPSCPNHSHLAGHIYVTFTTPTGGRAYSDVNLTADNEGGRIDEWRYSEGYYGSLANANVEVKVKSRCDSH